MNPPAVGAAAETAAPARPAPSSRARSGNGAGHRASRAAVGGTPTRERTLRTQGKKTLRRLLDASLVVFDKRGYHAARVDDIVRVAKTSHGTFYLYFSSKEDLFRALLAEVSQEMMALSESLPSITPGKAGWRELRDWLGQFYDLYIHYHPVIRSWMESEVGNIDLGRLGAGVLVGFMHSLVERVEEIDPRPVDDPGMAALAMVAMVERLSYYSVIQIVPLERDALLDTMATILHNGLLGGARRRR